MKVAVVGVGKVGSHIAYSLIERGLTYELPLYDINQQHLKGDALDLSHMLAETYTRKVVPLASLSEMPHMTDVVVIAAGRAQRPGEKRADLLADNAPIVRKIVEEIEKTGNKPIYLVVTNPLDVMVHVVWDVIKDDARVIGTGTFLDTMRLKYILAKRAGKWATPMDVTGMVLGEHGPHSFVLWEGVTISGRRPEEFGIMAEHHPEIEEEVRRAAYDVFALKGATYHAIAFAAAELVDHIFHDTHTIVPISVPVEFEGQRTALSLPVKLGLEGMEGIAMLDKPPHILDKIRIAAKATAELISKL